MNIRGRLIVIVTAAVALLGACAQKPPETTAAPAAKDAAAAPPVAQAGPNPLRNAYFGDLHLHTGYSMDAFAFGTRLTPDDAYHYAQGETVTYFGKPQKRHAPLDFLAVTDHAEYLGVVRQSIDPNGPFAKSPWFAMMTSTDPASSGEAFKLSLIHI